MEEISSQEHELDQPGESRWPLNGRADSVMRSFLESNTKLVWTDELENFRPDRSQCRFRGHYFPSIGKSISKGKCSIDRWTTNSKEAPPFSYRKPFATKELRRVSGGRDDEIMADISTNGKLHHPHVAVFLGAFERNVRPSILMLPSACFNLEEFTKRVSDDLEKVRDPATP